MIAAQKHQHQLAIGHEDQALHLGAFRQACELAHFGDRLAARRVELFRRQFAFGIGYRRRAGLRGGLLAIRRVAALAGTLR